MGKPRKSSTPTAPVEPAPRGPVRPRPTVEPLTALGDLLALLGIEDYDRGLGVLHPKIERKKGRYRSANVPLGRLWGLPLRLAIELPRGEAGEWPAGFNRPLAMPVAAMFGAIQDAHLMPLNEAAARNGIDPHNLAKAYRAFGRRLAELYPPALPPGCRYLGLDVAHFGGGNHLVVCSLMPKDEGRSYVLAVLPFGKKQRPAAAACLANLGGRERLRAVAIDLSSELRSFIAEAFGKEMPVVADTRHVLRDILRPLASARRAAAKHLPPRFATETKAGAKRETIKALLEAEPHSLDEDQRNMLELVLRLVPESELQGIHALAQRVRNFLKIETRAKAEERMAEIVRSVRPTESHFPLVQPFLNTFSRKWAEEILNRCDHPITTAAVERRIRSLKNRAALWPERVKSFDYLYTRTLVHDGAITAEAVQRLAWETAEQATPRGNNGEHDI